MSFTLDTNILIHLLRESPLSEKLSQTYFNEERPTLMISIVSQAEIESVAIQHGYGLKKIQKLRKLLSEFLIIPISDRQLIDRYVEIDAYSQGRLANQPLTEGMSARNMGKNDLWIAATASVTRTPLITTDKDFDHLIDSGFLKVIRL